MYNMLYKFHGQGLTGYRYELYPINMIIFILFYLWNPFANEQSPNHDSIRAQWEICMGPAACLQ